MPSQALGALVVLNQATLAASLDLLGLVEHSRLMEVGVDLCQTQAKVVALEAWVALES